MNKNRTKNSKVSDAEFIHKAALFQKLTPEEREEIASVCVPMYYEAGQIVCKENDPADCMYVIRSGSIEVWWNYDKIGMQTLLGNYSAGSIFGEMALLDNSPRSATVLAKTKLELLLLSVEDFHNFLNKSTNLARALLVMLSTVIRTSNNLFTLNLQERNKQLTEANNELKYTQRMSLRNERLATLGKLSSLIVHDIRNPISVIKCYVELMLHSYDNPEQVKSYGQSLQHAVQRLEDMSSDILDYSRGEMRLNVAIIKINNFLATLSEQVEQDMRMEGIRFSVVCHLDESFSFFADEGKLLRALVNLLDNSRKACKKNDKIILTIAEDKKKISFELSDSGTGMSQEVLDHMSDPFYSASARGGYGLGMVASQSIIEAHGGKIAVDSKVGQGTTVKFSIPKQL